MENTSVPDSIARRCPKHNRWLVLDVPFLAWRNYHVMGFLRHGEDPTGIAYGVLRDVRSFQDRHGTTNVAFCFDAPPSKRAQVYPAYKLNRKRGSLTPEEAASKYAVAKQIDRLRDELLPEVGFRNVFHQAGYEADDVIASVVQRSVIAPDEAVIVSADKDLYQLLSGQVTIWNVLPNGKPKLVTAQSFRDEYGIAPRQWIDVKAIAGCTSDNVRGVRGVGEVRACQWLRGELKPASKALQAIRDGGEVIEQNRQLVKLPYPGTKVFALRPDEITVAKWRAVAAKLGITTIRDFVA